KIHFERNGPKVIVGDPVFPFFIVGVRSRRNWIPVGLVPARLNQIVDFIIGEEPLLSGTASLGPWPIGRTSRAWIWHFTKRAPITGHTEDQLFFRDPPREPLIDRLCDVPIAG